MFGSVYILYFKPDAHTMKLNYLFSEDSCKTQMFVKYHPSVSINSYFKPDSHKKTQTLNSLFSKNSFIELE